MIIKTDDDWRILCDEHAIEPGWASPFEVYGRVWDERGARWVTEKNLYYVSDYEVEPRQPKLRRKEA